MTNPRFQAGADSMLIVAELRKAAVGDVVSYAHLSGAIGKVVTGATGALRTAIKKMETDHDAVFGVVTSVGVKRLSDSEIVDFGGSVIDRSRRLARRGVKTMSKANFEKLPMQQQAAHSARISTLATIAAMTSGPEQKRLEGACMAAPRQLPVPETLKMFLSKGVEQA